MTKGTYKDGTLSFKISEYGITLNYDYVLDKPTEMGGTFNAKLLMKGMMEGSTKLTKVE